MDPTKKGQQDKEQGRPADTKGMSSADKDKYLTGYGGKK
jgi:hypothetical protein